MSATLAISPPAVALSKNAILARITTDRVQASKAVITLTFTGLPIADEQIQISFAGLTLQFTFKDTPNLSGLQLPLPDGSITSGYLGGVVEHLRRNEKLSAQFSIVAVSNTHITLTAWTHALLSPTVLETSAAITATVVAGAGIYTVPSLSCVLKIVDPSTDAALAQLSGNYALKTTPSVVGVCDFDLSNILPVAPYLPSAASLGTSIPYAAQIASGAYAAYRLRYADRFGIVPTTESLVASTQVFNIIYGGNRQFSGRSFEPNTNGVYLCTPFSTTTTHGDNPAYTYIFPTIAPSGGNVLVNVRCTMSNGTTADFSVGSAHTWLTHTLYCYPTGFEQLRIPAALATLSLDPCEVVKYEWQIVRLSDGGVLVSRTFEVATRYANSLTLAVQNDCGGIEIVNIGNNYEWENVAENTTVNFADGSIGLYDARLFASVKVSVIVSDNIADFLREMMKSRIWLVSNGVFVPMQCETKTLKADELVGNFVSLAFSLRQAYEEENNY